MKTANPEYNDSMSNAEIMANPFFQAMNEAIITMSKAYIAEMEGFKANPEGDSISRAHIFYRFIMGEYSRYEYRFRKQAIAMRDFKEAHFRICFPTARAREIKATQMSMADSCIEMARAMIEAFESIKEAA